MQPSPIFKSIMEKIHSLSETERHAPENHHLFVLAYRHAPPELKEMFERGVEEMGLVPKPSHVDENGNAVFSIEELAEFYGITAEEARTNLAKVESIMPGGSFGVFAGPVHRLH